MIAIFGLKLGVDFRGGSVLELFFNTDRPAIKDVAILISAVKPVSDVAVTPVGDKNLIVRLNEINEVTHQTILTDLKNKYPKVVENRFDSVGPTVGNELKNNSIWAVGILLVVISIYIAYVFRKMSRILSSWAMGTAAIVAMFHDVLIPVGVFVLLGRFKGVEISAVFVAAILTIIGYSVSDTVVVFDRVRENVLRFGSKEGFSQIVHKSIMQTLSRSINTNITVLLSLIAIFFFGGENIKYFALALIIGIFLGAYSSIFVASPILVWWSNKRGR